MGPFPRWKQVPGGWELPQLPPLTGGEPWLEADLESRVHFLGFFSLFLRGLRREGSASSQLLT